MLAAPAAASPREYNQGYNDCLRGQIRRGRVQPRLSARLPRRPARAGARTGRRPQGGRGGARRRRAGYGGRPGTAADPMGPERRRTEGRGPPPPRRRGHSQRQGHESRTGHGHDGGSGFRNVGTEVAGAAIYGFYFNPMTGECVQVANMNGRTVGATRFESAPDPRRRSAVVDPGRRRPGAASSARARAFRSLAPMRFLAVPRRTLLGSSGSSSFRRDEHVRADARR